MIYISKISLTFFNIYFIICLGEFQKMSTLLHHFHPIPTSVSPIFPTSSQFYDLFLIIIMLYMTKYYINILFSQASWRWVYIQNYCELLWKSMWQFLRKLGTDLPQDPALPLLNIYAKDSSSYYEILFFQTQQVHTQTHIDCGSMRRGCTGSSQKVSQN